MTSEAKADLKIELSDLNYLCSNASLACKGFLEMIDTTDNNKRPIMIHRPACFAADKNSLKFASQLRTLLPRERDRDRRCRLVALSWRLLNFTPGEMICSRFAAYLHGIPTPLTFRRENSLADGLLGEELSATSFGTIRGRPCFGKERREDRENREREVALRVRGG